MKLTIVLLTAGFLNVSAIGVSQNITFSGKNVSLEAVFSSIEKQSGVVFLYTGPVLQAAKPVTISAADMPLADFLKEIFKNQPLKYSLDGKSILVTLNVSGSVDQPLNKSETDFLLNVDTLIDVRGRVVDEKGEPLAGVTVTVKETNKATSTDENGYFTIMARKGDVLEFSYVGHEAVNSNVKDNSVFITLKPSIDKLDAVTVYSTGYEKISPERTTGSFAKVNNEDFNRRISGTILDRIENLVPGVLFNHGAPDPLLIRGRSTIHSDPRPLIVVDNFPYDGNINNINPNDIEDITVLKDAASASIWGARAANGVIVISTKKGKTISPQVSFNINSTIQQKPNLSELPIISSVDFIEVEKFLFSQNFYRAPELQNNRNLGHPAFTPVVELLLAKKNGIISAEEADAGIELLKNLDARTDLESYFYRKAVNQQYAVNVSGNTKFINYYMSAGWDHGRSELVGMATDRITFRTQNTFKVTKGLDIDAGINYSQRISKSGNNSGVNLKNGSKGLYPYADIVDENGNALPLVHNLRGLYTDTVTGGKLLDWTWRPYAEIDATKNLNKTRDIVLNTSVQYRLNSYLSAEAKYQYENSLLSTENLSTIEAYSTRDLINSFTQIGLNGALSFPVPKGGIMNLKNNEIVSHQGRVQIRYAKKINSKHEIAALAGWEIKNVTLKSNGSILYGYNRDGSLVSPVMDFVTEFDQYYYKFNTVGATLKSRIPNSQSISEQSDRFISTFGNASYTYDSRYTFSISGRHDAANLFGAETNRQRGLPLWSVGGAWQIHNENFFKPGFFTFLKVRATYGYNGNIVRSTTGVTTIQIGVSPNSGYLSSYIINPPNEKLKWEQVRVANIGLDFSIINDRVTGTIEYYSKHAKDLLGGVPVDRTLGVGAVIFANTANMKGTGIDLLLQSKNFDRNFKWQTTFILSASFNKVTEYLLPVSTRGSDYLLGITPIVGKPVYSMFSYFWAGLDPLTGDPQGYIGKDASKNYSTIINNTSLDSMAYSGSLQPTHYGSLRNDFSWKNFSLSINLSFKFGYYFRRNSIRYSSLFTNWTGHSDYSKRWQQPGDEESTNVPSMVYPANGQRDDFYLNSATLVEKADNIRIEDIRCSYNISKSQWKALPFKQLTIYAYTSIGRPIWKANGAGKDPYYNDGLRQGVSIAFGINANL